MHQNLFRIALFAGLLWSGASGASARDKAVTLDPEKAIEILYVTTDSGGLRTDVVSKFRADAIRGGGKFLAAFEVVGGGDDEARPTHVLLTQWKTESRRSSFRRSIGYRRVADALVGSEVFAVGEGQQVAFSKGQTYAFETSAAGTAEALELKLQADAPQLEKPLYSAEKVSLTLLDSDDAAGDSTDGLILRVIR